MNLPDALEEIDRLAKLCEKLSRDVVERDALIKEYREFVARFWHDRANEQADTITELKKKVAEAELDVEAEKECYEDTNKALNHVTDELFAATATIESLNLRVAWLVDALKAIEHGDDTAPETMRWAATDALSSESDNQWLREKQAELYANALRIVDAEGKEGLAHEIRRLEELRNQSPVKEE